MRVRGLLEKVAGVMRRTWILWGLVVVATVWCVRPVNDIDVQWHVKIGEWMLDRGQVVREDFYSVSKWGREWTSVPWLYQCIMAWLVRHAGWMGPTVWQWLVALGVTVQTAYLIWLYRERRRARAGVEHRTWDWDWRWPALTVPAALGVLETLRVAEVRFQHRPEMTTHVLLGTYVIILTLWQRWSAGGREDKLFPRLLWLLPVLQIWWANTHGVFALGPIIVWTIFIWGVISAIVGGELKRRGRSLAHLGGVALAVVVACFISPYGVKTALYPIHLYYVLTAPEYKYGIAEAVPVSVVGMWRAGGWNWVLLAEWVLAGVGAVVMTWRGASGHAGAGTGGVAMRIGRIEFGYLCVCAGMFYIALTAVRNIALFHIVAAPLMVLGVQAVVDASIRVANTVLAQVSEARLRIARWHSIAARVAYALLLMMLYWSIVSERYYERFHRQMRFGFGQSSHTFPIAGLDFLEGERTNMAPLAMLGDTKSADMFLNRFGTAWPTYIEGRHAEVYDAPFFAAYGAALGVRGVFFIEAGKYGVGVAMFGTESLPAGGADLQRDIYRHPGWRLVYLDDCAVIFVADVVSNRAVTSRYALPPAPAAMDEQEQVYQEWLRRCGRERYDLVEERNDNMITAKWARVVVKALQLGGLWGPRVNREAWQRALVGGLLTKLGWAAVADNIYELAMQGEPLHKGVAEEAINHAVACYEACETAEAKAIYLRRLRQRAAALQEAAAQNEVAQYGLAFAEYAGGELMAAMMRLETLVGRRKDALIYDLLARTYGELGDAAATPAEQERLWRKAVKTWRERLRRHPGGPGTFRAYFRLGDLFVRLKMPLQARANYVLGLNEPDVPAQTAVRARARVRELEGQLFGVSYVPSEDGREIPVGPFSVPDGAGELPQSVLGGGPGVPLGREIVPGAALPAQAPPRENRPRAPGLYPPLTNAAARALGGE